MSINASLLSPSGRSFVFSTANSIASRSPSVTDPFWYLRKISFAYPHHGYLCLLKYPPSFLQKIECLFNAFAVLLRHFPASLDSDKQNGSNAPRRGYFFDLHSDDCPVIFPLYRRFVQLKQPRTDQVTFSVTYLHTLIPAQTAPALPRGQDDRCSRPPPARPADG